MGLIEVKWFVVIRERVSKNSMSNPKLYGCRGKLPIFTYDHAVEKRNEFKKRMGETLSIYRCKFCKFLHLGHKVNEQLHKISKGKPSNECY